MQYPSCVHGISTLYPAVIHTYKVQEHLCYLRHDEKRPNDANDEVIIHRKSSYSKKGYFVKSLNVLTHGASVIYLVELLIETGYF